MNDYSEIIDKLKRLEKQAHMSISIIELTGMVEIGKGLGRFNEHSTPNTFEVGDFIVTDRLWT